MDIRSFGLSEEELRQLGYDVKGRSGGDGDPRPAGPPGSPSTRRPASPALRIWIATLVLLPLVAWGSGLQRGLPAPVPAAASDAAFSSARAMAQLVEIAQRPHPTGSPELERVRTVILGRLTSLGLEPEVQVSTAFVRDSSTVRAATVRNIVTRIPGSGSTGAVELRAHYDSAPLSPGAGDNGVGVAILLETVRALLVDPPRNDVIVVFTDGGEVDGLGARAFTTSHPWAADVFLTVALDSRGARGPVVLAESLTENGPFIEALAGTTARHTASSLTRALSRDLRESGRATAPDEPSALVTLTAFGATAWEDQTRDVRDEVSERTLQHGGEQLLALTRAVGALDLQRELAGPGRAYLSLPRVGIVHYPTLGVLLTSLGLVALWGLVGFVIRVRRGRRNAVLGGIALGLVVVGLSAAAGSMLLGLVADLHPEHGLLHTALYEDGPHVLATVLVAFSIASVAYAVARRWLRIDELLFGALLTPLGLVLWLTFAAADAAPSLQWPLALALLATALVTVLGPRRGISAWSWAAVLLLSLATLLLVVPAMQLVAGAWTFERATALGALGGMGALLLLPLMDWLQRPKPWATPLLAVLAASVVVALQLPSVQGGVDHPQPSTLVYLAEEPAAALPTGPAAGLPVDTSRVRIMLGNWLTVPGPGEVWARSWVGQPPTGSTAAGVLFLGPDSLYEVAGSGPDSEMAPPRVSVVSSVLESARRSVVLSVESGLGGEMTAVHVPAETVAELTGVGGVTWSTGPAPVRSLVHWGSPEGGALRVGLSLPMGATETELLVVEHHLRPREVLGAAFYERADSLVANAAMGSDRVIQRTVVRVPIAEVLEADVDAPSAPSEDADPSGA